MINVVFWKLLVLNYNNTHYIWHVSLKVKVLKKCDDFMRVSRQKKFSLLIQIWVERLGQGNLVLADSVPKK